MDRFNIRNYLYHGIENGVYIYDDRNSQLRIFESILKTEHLLCGDDLKKCGVESCCTYYDKESGWSPRISLGFYPLNEEIYKISYDASRFKNSMPENLTEYVSKLPFAVNAKEDLDNIIINLDTIDMVARFAWKNFYQGITFIFDPSLLNDNPALEYAALYDEICVAEKVSLRKYLVAIAIPVFVFETTYCGNQIIERERYHSKYIEILKLLKKYNYNVPVINFTTGELLNERGSVLVRVKKRTLDYY